METSQAGENAAKAATAVNFDANANKDSSWFEDAAALGDGIFEQVGRAMLCGIDSEVWDQETTKSLDYPSEASGSSENSIENSIENSDEASWSEEDSMTSGSSYSSYTGSEGSDGSGVYEEIESEAAVSGFDKEALAETPQLIPEDEVMDSEVLDVSFIHLDPNESRQQVGEERITNKTIVTVVSPLLGDIEMFSPDVEATDDQLISQSESKGADESTKEDTGAILANLKEMEVEKTIEDKVSPESMDEEGSDVAALLKETKELLSQDPASRPEAAPAVRTVAPVKVFTTEELEAQRHEKEELFDNASSVVSFYTEGAPDVSDLLDTSQMTYKELLLHQARKSAKFYLTPETTKRKSAPQPAKDTQESREEKDFPSPREANQLDVDRKTTDKPVSEESRVKKELRQAEESCIATEKRLAKEFGGYLDTEAETFQKVPASPESKASKEVQPVLDEPTYSEPVIDLRAAGEDAPHASAAAVNKMVDEYVRLSKEVREAEEKKTDEEVLQTLSRDKESVDRDTANDEEEGSTDDDELSLAEEGKIEKKERDRLEFMRANNPAEDEDSVQRVLDIPDHPLNKVRSSDTATTWSGETIDSGATSLQSSPSRPSKQSSIIWEVPETSEEKKESPSDEEEGTEANEEKKDGTKNRSIVKRFSNKNGELASRRRRRKNLKDEASSGKSGSRKSAKDDITSVKGEESVKADRAAKKTTSVRSRLRSMVRLHGRMKRNDRRLEV